MLTGDGEAHLSHDEIFRRMRHFPLPYLLIRPGKTGRSFDGTGLGLAVDPAPVEIFEHKGENEDNNRETGLEDLIKPEDRGDRHQEHGPGRHSKGEIDRNGERLMPLPYGGERRIDLRRAEDSDSAH